LRDSEGVPPGCFPLSELFETLVEVLGTAGEQVLLDVKRCDGLFLDRNPPSPPQVALLLLFSFFLRCDREGLSPFPLVFFLVEM